MHEAAIQAYRKLIEIAPEEKGTGLVSIAAILYATNRKAEADSLMPEVSQLAEKGKIDAYGMTVVYTVAGQLDQAFDWFDKALADGMLLARFIRYAPELDPLRADPRFVELLRKHGRERLADELSAH